MVVLIPSYEPDLRLVDIVVSLTGHGHTVTVVDDGSGPAYATLFDQALGAGATVLRHETNRGKGAALKTGFAHLGLAHPGEDIVCADSDGQHTVQDIERVAAGLKTSGADLVLGARRFTGKVPTRSRFGNAVSRKAFSLATGQTLLDTQTGLRAHAARTLGWLGSVPGERFDYESRVLLSACRDGRSVEEVEIETIYLDDNASSHFRPIQDSFAIYRQLLAFLASSFIGFGVDVLALFALSSVTSSVVVTVVGARLLSASVNYTLNRRWVFARRTGVAPKSESLAHYAALASVILLLNVLLMASLVAVTGSLLISKVTTELVLLSLSYIVQRTVVFRSSVTASSGSLVTPKVRSRVR